LKKEVLWRGATKTGQSESEKGESDDIDLDEYFAPQDN
jgi:hypothetical protein